MASNVNTKAGGDGNTVKLVLAWGLVGIPFAWGVIETIIKSLPLFQ